MKCNNTLKTVALIVSTVLVQSFFSACEKVDITPDPIAVEGKAIILNNGNWGSNDACITLYDLNENTSQPSAFLQTNNYGLGDLGQDICKAADGKLFISVSGSKTVFMTDNTLKVQSSIPLGFQPRYFAVNGNDIYVSLYEGYLARLRDGRFYGMTKVGPNPEGVAIYDGKAYVANSGGMVQNEQKEYIYNNTVSVVDLNNFTETSTITVGTNPQKVCLLGSNIYVNCWGNYNDIPASLYRINGNQADIVLPEELNGVYSIACDGDRLYVLCCTHDENWNTVGSVKVINKGFEDKVITLVDNIDLAYSISAGSNGFYVGCSDYKTEGKVLAYNTGGELLFSTPSYGLNPQAVLEY